MKRQLLLAALAGSLLVGPPAAAAPGNDDFANAQEIGAPSQVVADLTGSTVEVDEDTWCGVVGQPRSVWYRVDTTPGEPLELSGADATFNAAVELWVGDSLATLRYVACTSPEQGHPSGPWRFRAPAETLYIRISPLDIWSQSEPVGPEQVRLTLGVASGDPSWLVPPNGTLAGVTVVDSLPFHESAYPRRDAPDPADPACVPTSLGFGLRSGSVWYRYAPDHDHALLVNTWSSGVHGSGVYQIEPDGLVELSCSHRDPYSEHDDGNRAHVAVDLEAGSEYAVVAWTDSPYQMSVTLIEPPAHDVALIGASATLPFAAPSWLRFGFQWESSVWNPSGATGYAVVRLCPSGQTSGCTTFGPIEFGVWGSPKDARIDRFVAGCIGDYDLSVEISSPFYIDPDPTNDSITVPVTIGASGPATICEDISG